MPEACWMASGSTTPSSKTGAEGKQWKNICQRFKDDELLRCLPVFCTWLGEIFFGDDTNGNHISPNAHMRGDMIKT